jgi:hypothetical protein
MLHERPDDGHALIPRHTVQAQPDVSGARGHSVAAQDTVDGAACRHQLGSVAGRATRPRGRR